MSSPGAVEQGSDRAAGNRILSRSGPRLFGALALLALVLTASGGCSQEPSASPAPDALRVDPERREIRIRATVDRGRFQGPLAQAMQMNGYHLLVAEGGGASQYSLFVTEVSDRAIYDALAKLAGAPGPGLPIETWSRRGDADHPAPERVALGHRVFVSVTWDGRETPAGLSEFLRDPAGRGFDFVFTGNLANIPAWKSGCGICLVSCPGGKVANAAYTVRDYVNGIAAFRVIGDRLPSDGTEVTVILRVD